MFSDHQMIRSLPLCPAKKFTFAQMEAATKGFQLEAKIGGEGSFGTVYRGYLPDWGDVAIKREDASRFQESEFLSEVAFLSRSRLRHKNLVRLVGYCSENKECLLVSEYMKNGALYDHLHPKAAPSDSSPSLSLVMSSWKLRIRILLGASRGIEYLHLYADSRIIHGNIKSSNILLDASWRARLSGFGLLLMERQARRTRVHWTVARTVGYMDPDPEYYNQHYLTEKSDVYSFGVVMLEVLTGKRAILGVSTLSVVDYAVPSIVSGEFGKILDPCMPDPDTHEAEALGLVAYTALHCVQLKGKDRPGMEGIVVNLQTALNLSEGSDLVKSSDSLPVIMPH